MVLLIQYIYQKYLNLQINDSQVSKKSILIYEYIYIYIKFNIANMRNSYFRNKCFGNNTQRPLQEPSTLYFFVFGYFF
ncbi:hypothetical protein CCAN2_880001 [Capnocytophaga canimorsus]|nr:hypothetical protein CCAN2_880001 [Capnocytophaga canimorsus]